MNRHDRRKNIKNKATTKAARSSATLTSEMDQASLLKLREAIVAQQAGDTEAAQKTYRALLKKFPNNPDCLNFLGVAARDNGNFTEAEKFIRQAIQYAPTSLRYKDLVITLLEQHRHEEARDVFAQYMAASQPDASDNYFMGRLLRQMNDYDGSLSYLMKVIEQNPADAPALNTMGAVYLDTGRIDEAYKSLMQAYEIDPNNAHCLSNLGLYYSSVGETNQARALLQRALEIEPNNQAAATNLADISTLEELETTYASLQASLEASTSTPQTLASLANLAIKIGRAEDALHHMHQAIQIAPEDPHILTSLAEALLELHHNEEAVPYIEAALRIDPLFFRAYICYGDINKNLFDYEFSAACYAQALSIKPGNTNVILRIANLLQEMGHYERAGEAFHSILEANPNLADGHYNRAFLLLRQCRLKEAWEEYHWRYRSQKFWVFSPIRHFTQPEWDGEPLKGKKIVVYSEQGLGDQIQYATMLPDIIATGANITFEIEPRLISLYQRTYPDITVVPQGLSPADAKRAGFDYHIATPDLCRFYRNDISDFPVDPRPLVVDADEAGIWKNRFAEISNRPKIGIGWRSGAASRNRAHSYAQIDELGPLLSVKGVDFINIQYSSEQEELDEIKERYGIELHAWNDIDLKNQQDRFAALLSELDLAISPATATAHLAGALGVKSFIYLLPSIHTYNLGQSYVPWFKDQQVFFKENPPVEWEATFNDIAAETRKVFNLS